MNRADAWMLMDAWIKEVLKLTFEELASPLPAQSNQVLFNVLLHGLKPGGVVNYYNWFQNADAWNASDRQRDHRKGTGQYA